MIEKYKAVRALAAVLEMVPDDPAKPREEQEWLPLAQAMGLYPYEAWDTNSDRTTRGGVRAPVVRMPEIVEMVDGVVPYEADVLPRVMGKVC